MKMTCRVGMRCLRHMGVRMFVNDTVACVANRMAVDMAVSYECRRLEPSLNRRRDMLLSCGMRLGRGDSSGCMSSQPRFDGGRASRGCPPSLFQNRTLVVFAGHIAWVLIREITM